MSAAAWAGYMTGTFVTLLVLSMVLVALLRLIPPLKRHPEIPYAGAALLIVLLTISSVMGEANSLSMILAGVLALVVLAWDYRRAAKKMRAQVPSANVG